MSSDTVSFQEMLILSIQGTRNVKIIEKREEFIFSNSAVDVLVSRWKKM